MVSAFQHEDDVERFYRMLPKRLKKFGLEVAQEKTNRPPLPEERQAIYLCRI